jgi:hypothetical protein
MLGLLLIWGRVQQGAMSRHPEVDFTTWAPVRSKAMLQAFADFLVACKKEEKGAFSFFILHLVLPAQDLQAYLVL